MTAWLVLRPEPGATATARRIAALGRDAIVAPLFAIEPADWTPPPPERFDALMLTSANAVRAAGDALGRYRHLPAYAVGAATADALRAAGFGDVRTGPGDAETLLDEAVADGRTALLHLAGADRREAGRTGVAIMRITIYRAVATAGLPPLGDATLALLHSPRAAARFASLVAPPRRADIAIAAISPAALAAAGGGWRAGVAAAAPDDDALLAAAAALCEKE